MINESLKLALQDSAKKLGKNGDAVVKNYQDAVEKHRAQRLENGATDIMTTGNTGYGAETTVETEYSDEIYSMIRELPWLLSMLPANHWQKKADGSVIVPVIGEVALWDGIDQQSGSTTFADRVTTSNAVNTGKVEIVLRDFSTVIAISKRDLHSASDEQFYQKIQNRILLGLQRTLEAYILNSDPSTDTSGGTANVNFLINGGTPTLPANAYYLGGGAGVRKTGIANTIVGGNQAFGRSILLSLMGAVDNLDNLDNLMWIGNSKVLPMVSALAEYATADKTANATNDKGFVKRMEGIGLYLGKDFPALNGVTGKVEVGTTTANNFRSLALLHKYAPQYCFGRDIEVVVLEDAQNIYFDCAGSFGVAMHNNIAGMGKTIALGVFQK
jgi:hypothetical protein